MVKINAYEYTAEKLQKLADKYEVTVADVLSDLVSEYLDVFIENYL